MCCKVDIVESKKGRRHMQVIIRGTLNVLLECLKAAWAYGPECCGYHCAQGSAPCQVVVPFAARMGLKSRYAIRWFDKFGRVI